MLSHRESHDSHNKYVVSRSSHRPRISVSIWFIEDRTLSHQWVYSESCHLFSPCFHTLAEPHPNTHTVSCIAMIILVFVGRLATPFHFITFIKYLTGDSCVCHSSDGLVKAWQDINTLSHADALCWATEKWEFSCLSDSRLLQLTMFLFSFVLAAVAVILSSSYP